MLFCVNFLHFYVRKMHACVAYVNKNVYLCAVLGIDLYAYCKMSVSKSGQIVAYQIKILTQ